jgi:hypothetical protein
MYTIQATDGARTQEKRLNCTESEAKMRRRKKHVKSSKSAIGSSESS